VDPREGRYRAALEAPLVASAGEAQAMMHDEVAGQSSIAMSASVDAPLATDRHGRFMADAGRRSATVLATAVDPAPGPYALQAGTMIPAVLVTEINSDLPGEILAQVSRDVYDSRTQETLLIPKGSKLLGKYDNQIAVAQDRLLVAWTRVIFPDGRSISLPGLATKDGAGAGGLRDQVDEHRGRVFGTAALLSLITAGAQLSQPNGGYGAWGAYPSAGQIAAGAAGQQFAEVAAQMLRRNMDVQPTIRIRQGMPFNVFLSMDLTFAEPWMTRTAGK
jgi:type IV secretion system protein VirB10